MLFDGLFESFVFFVSPPALAIQNTEPIQAFINLADYLAAVYNFILEFLFLSPLHRLYQVLLWLL